MEKITPPPALKRIVVSLINIAVFILYYFIWCFVAGLIIGLIEVVAVTDMPDSTEDLFLIAALVINITLTVIFRKKIYFGIVSHPTVPPPPQTPHSGI
ncbi:MAG: hypothetical protein RL094_758 [Candidatus Parcubacteria bacterium]|jgi:hypothetical protein